VQLILAQEKGKVIAILDERILERSRSLRKEREFIICLRGIVSVGVQLAVMSDQA